MGDDSLLLGIRIEQQAVGIEASRVRIPRVYRCVTLSKDAHRVRVPADRIEQRVVENSSGTHHVRRNITQIGDRECGDNHCTVNVGNETVQPIERTVRSERPVVIGQRDESPLIKGDSELVSEFASESGVEVQSARQLNLEVVPFAVHRNRTQQHRCREMLVAVHPGHEADGEEHRVDSACGGEFDRFVVDAQRALSGTVKRNIIANKISQKCRRAGKESGEAAGVTRAQFDCDVAGEMQKGVRSTKFRQFTSPLFPHGVGDVGDCRRCVTGGEV